MVSISVNALCPCHSGHKYKKCCRPYHQKQNAPTPLLLMRSRYSAYALGLFEVIIATTHPESPHHMESLNAWKDEILAFCNSTQFVGLEILSVDDADAHDIDPMSYVAFQAELLQAGKTKFLRERSLFKRHHGEWFYVSGVDV